MSAAKEHIKATVKDLLGDYLEGLKYEPKVRNGDVLEALVEYVLERCDEVGLPPDAFDDMVRLTRLAQAAGARHDVDPKAVPS